MHCINHVFNAVISCTTWRGSSTPVYLIFESPVYLIFESPVYLIFESPVYLIFESPVYLIFESPVYLMFESHSYWIYLSSLINMAVFPHVNLYQFLLPSRLILLFLLAVQLIVVGFICTSWYRRFDTYTYSCHIAVVSPTRVVTCHLPGWVSLPRLARRTM